MTAVSTRIRLDTDDTERSTRFEEQFASWDVITYPYCGNLGYVRLNTDFEIALRCARNPSTYLGGRAWSLRLTSRPLRDVG